MKIEGAKGDWAFLEGVDVKVAVAHGLGNAQKVIDQVKSGEAEYHFIEVMTCPGGCIGGGGQPRLTTNEVRRKRIEAIYQEDEGRAAAQVAREPGRLRPLRGVPRGAVRRDLAPPAAHALQGAGARLRRGGRERPAKRRPPRPSRYTSGAREPALGARRGRRPMKRRTETTSGR